MRRLLSFLGDREIATGILRGILLGALILAGVNWWMSTSLSPSHVWSPSTSSPPSHVHRQDSTKPKESIGRVADLRGERSTPAGRFVGERGHNARGEDVVWLDYDAAVSMHRVLTSNPEERRLERLATPTSDDKRISYGCINVPVDFYETYIQPMFATQR